MTAIPLRPAKRSIMQRLARSESSQWFEYHQQTETETPADLERLAARLRTIFPAHRFHVR